MARSLWTGYVYLLESQGLYKVGFSHEPHMRVKRLQTGSPFPVRLVHIIKTNVYRQLEDKLHYDYRSKKVRGEWFALSDEDVTRFKLLNAFGRTPDEQEKHDEGNRRWSERTKTPEELQIERDLNSLMGAICRSIVLDPPTKNVTPSAASVNLLSD